MHSLQQAKPADPVSRGCRATRDDVLLPLTWRLQRTSQACTRPNKQLLNTRAPF